MKIFDSTVNAILIFLSLFISSLSWSAETVTYFHNDLLGSPVAATDANGFVVWKQQQYKPYGERIKDVNNDVQNDIWFTGKPEDYETGLIYMNARYYDPRIGRFLSVDPVGPLEGGYNYFNRYSYAANNPYKYTDPSGEFLNFILGGISGGIQNAAMQSLEMSLGMRDEFSLSELGADVALGSVTSGLSTVKTAGKLAALSHKVTKGPLWTSTKSKSAVENAFGHWSKHKSEFPEFQNAKQYVEGTQKFLNSPPKGALTKTRSNGDTLLYDPKTNTFGVKDVNGAPRTMFRPEGGMDYWNKQ